MPIEQTIAPDKAIKLRPPRPEDGAALWQLTGDTGVLDQNSPYAYFLLGEHFAGTSVVAEMDARVVGFVSGYCPPNKPNTLFIWQVGTDASVRKRGLAKRMILSLLSRDECQHVNALETTVTPSNGASRSLFASISKQVGATLEEHPDHFPTNFFPGEGHEAEALFVISPIQLPKS